MLSQSLNHIGHDLGSHIKRTIRISVGEYPAT